jgi:hypothetical protein
MAISLIGWVPDFGFPRCDVRSARPDESDVKSSYVGLAIETRSTSLVSLQLPLAPMRFFAIGSFVVPRLGDQLHVKREQNLYDPFESWGILAGERSIEALAPEMTFLRNVSVSIGANHIANRCRDDGGIVRR